MMETLIAMSSIVSTLIIGITAIVIWWQLRENQRQAQSNNEWNRRLTTQQMLNNIMLGEFRALRYQFEKECGCRVSDPNQCYETVKAKFEEEGKKEKIEEMESYLVAILNVFEAFAISMKNHIIDEDICYDNLCLLFIRFKRWSEAFINERRQKAADLQVWINFTNYADKWQLRKNKEKAEMAQKAVITGKAAL